MIKARKTILIAAVMYVLTLAAYFTIEAILTGGSGTIGKNRGNPVVAAQEDTLKRMGDLDYGTDDYRQGLDLSCRGCNVLFINIDLLRADQVGLLNPAGNHTPNIDRFFEKSIIFEQAQAPAGDTYSSNIAVLTASEVVDILETRYFDPSYKYQPATIQEKLADGGYYTLNLNQGDYSGRATRMDVGFEGYVQIEDRAPPNDSVALMIEKIRSEARKPFFTLYHPDTLHHPYDFPRNYLERIDMDDQFISTFYEFRRDKLWIGFAVPKEYSSKVIEGPLEKIDEDSILYVVFQDEYNRRINFTYRNRESMFRYYSLKVEYTDGELAPLLKFIDDELGNDTIVVLYANHGESLSDNKQFQHGVSYQSCVHVPLMIKHPKVKEQVRVKRPVSLIDLAPTIYEMLGIYQGNISSFSLISVIKDDEYDREFIYGKSYKDEYILRGDWKLITSTQRGKELYNMRTDPKEQYNIIAQHQEIAALLDAELSREKMSSISQGEMGGIGT
ncbi:MAG: sulfatase-like hydrolase/transferase [Candidatus Altiarchaeota archaeon]